MHFQYKLGYSGKRDGVLSSLPFSALQTPKYRGLGSKEQLFRPHRVCGRDAGGRDHPQVATFGRRLGHLWIDVGRTQYAVGARELVG